MTHAGSVRQEEQGVVRVSRRIEAPREAVFDAWLDPDIRKEWWGRGCGSQDVGCDVDARVGGRYSLRAESAECGACEDHGVFREINRPERLVFTWTASHADAQAAKDYDVVDSEVTVEFVDVGGATEVILTHRGLPTEKSRDGHRQGWAKMLEAIEQTISGS